MNPCEEYEELISALIDGEVTPEEKEKLDEHLKSCKACASLLKLYQEISSELSALPEPPESFRKSVMEKIASLPEKTEKRGRIIHLKPWMATCAAAACLALVLLISPLRGAMQPKKDVQDGQATLAAAPSIAPEASLAAGAGAGACAVTPEGDDADLFAAADASEDCGAREEAGFKEAAPEPPANERRDETDKSSGILGGIQMAERPTAQGMLGFSRPGLTTPCPAVEITDAAVYYAVVTVCGEMPDVLSGLEFTVRDGYETAEISVETARALIEAGYAAEYGGAENNIALVVYYP